LHFQLGGDCTRGDRRNGTLCDVTCAVGEHGGHVRDSDRGGGREAEIAVVAQLDPADAVVGAHDLKVRVGDSVGQITSIETAQAAAITVAVVLDAGAGQATVIDRERDLATSVVKGLAAWPARFTIVRAGSTETTLSAVVGATEAMDLISRVTADDGSDGSVPIYDAISSSLKVLTAQPGLRALLFVGEGNDARSTVRLEGLKGEAEKEHIAFITALVADHALRGARGRLFYGRGLCNLALDTAGMCMLNETVTPAAGHIIGHLRALRLIRASLPMLGAGRYKAKVKSLTAGLKVKAQKAVVVR